MWDGTVYQRSSCGAMCGAEIVGRLGRIPFGYTNRSIVGRSQVAFSCAALSPAREFARSGVISSRKVLRHAGGSFDGGVPMVLKRTCLAGLGEPIADGLNVPPLPPLPQQPLPPKVSRRRA